MIKSLIVAWVIYSSVIGISFARDLGVRGPIYEIAEENLLSVMKHKLQMMQKNGEWTNIQRSIQNEVQRQSNMPQRVKGITSATQSRHWLYDPTWTLSQSIRDLKGRVIAQKGQKVNPLDYISLTEILVFIDATLEKEIHYLEKILYSEEKNIKVILVNGHVAELAKQLNRSIYFDQQGEITERFGIHHTPAIVKQQGKVLAIEEIAL